STVTAVAVNPVIEVFGHPSVLQFPGLGDTSFADESRDEIPDVAWEACEMLQDHFREKEELKARSNFLIYRRTGPPMLARMHIKAQERQKTAFAEFYDARRVQRRNLRALHRITAHLATVKNNSHGGPHAGEVDVMASRGEQEHNSNTTDQKNPTRRSSKKRAAKVKAEVVNTQNVGENGEVKVEDKGVKKEKEKVVTETAEKLLLRREALLERVQVDTGFCDMGCVARKRRERALCKFMEAGEMRGLAGDANAKKFTKNFMEYISKNMVDVLYHVFIKAQEHSYGDTLRDCIQAWHLWYLERNSVSLYNRQRMRNWLRICARLCYLHRGMPLYRHLRIKWAVFQKLLAAVEYRFCYGTDGLPQRLRRCSELLLGFSALLKGRGLVPGYYCPSVLLPATLDFRALFQRWKQHTQQRAMRRLLESLLNERRRLRQLRGVFRAWHMGFPPAAAATTSATQVELTGGNEKETVEWGGATVADVGGEGKNSRVSDEGEENYMCLRGCVRVREGREGTKKPFGELQVDSDLEVVRKTIVTEWKRSIVHAIGWRQRREEVRLKRTARIQPTFKMFMLYHQWQASERVRSESKLLVDAFLERGKLKFKDLSPPFTTEAVGGRSSGHDLVCTCDRPVPGAYLVSELRVLTRIGQGVVGIQLVMQGGKSRTMELSPHGAILGEGRTSRVHVFALDCPTERLSCFECKHGDTIERLRARTSTGRWSPWFGESLSEASHITILPDWSGRCAMAAVAIAEAKTTALEKGENIVGEGTPSVQAKGVKEAEGVGVAGGVGSVSAVQWDPHQEYITGLVGTQTSERLVSLGVVTRHVFKSHIFSYLWTSPEEPDLVNNDWGSRERNGADSSIEAQEVELSNSPRSQLSGPSSFSQSLSSGGQKNTQEPTSLRERLYVTVAGKDREGDSIGGAAGVDVEGSGETSISRLEMKRRRFLRDKAAREKKREQAACLAQVAAEEQRLIQEGDAREVSSPSKTRGGVGSGSGDISAIVSPQEEFSYILRMRRTDARRALERSMNLARAMWGQGGDSAQARHAAYSWAGERSNPLAKLSCIMGLVNWLHEALLPHLVPLPKPTSWTDALFMKGEKEIQGARRTADRAMRLKKRYQDLEDERRLRPRRGMLSPWEREREVMERE
ncbi:unnamed protein product, partial [Choristocarpus tenellus]